MVKIQKIIISNTDNIRIDRFLSEKFPDIPRRFFQKQISDGNITVNSKKTSPSYKLKYGDEIKIDVEHSPEKLKSPQPQQDIPFKVVFLHPDFAIIEKTAGLSVHPSMPEPKNTLVNGLLAKFPQIQNVGENPLRPGIVHRLDKDTSGLMIVALTQKSFEYFKNLFQTRKIKKNYQALVWGKLSDKEGQIKSLIGRSKRNPTKQAASEKPDMLSNPKEALTIYKLIKEFDDMSLVEASPQTGRKHQIRIHFHWIGHPLVGDKKYQTKLVKDKNKLYKRHLLHASYLSFEYFDGKKYEFKSQLPAEFEI